MNNLYHKILQDAGIRPSIQRMAVYAFLYENRIHPDVETVYNKLNPIYPTLSKTTIYNTLKLFEEKNIIRSIKIDDDKLRFDAEIKNHIHFKCSKCQNIYDIFLDENEAKKLEELSSCLPSGFSLSKSETNIWGLCKNCAKA